MRPEKSRPILYRFIGWFFLINTIISLLIVMNYFKVLPDFSGIPGLGIKGTALGWLFLIFSFVAQFTFLFFFCAVLMIGLLTLFPRRWLGFSLSIVMTSCLIFALFADSIAFNLYHMHYANVGWDIFKVGAVSEVILLSTPEKLLAVGIIFLLFSMEYVLANRVWHRIAEQKKGKTGYVVSGVLVAICCISYGLMFTASASAKNHELSEGYAHIILKAARIVPYYNETYGLFTLNHGIQRIDTSQGDVYFKVNPETRGFRYPLHPLRCELPKKRYNILIIAIDTWRYDAMNPQVTPNIYEFGKKTQQFHDHWSGGNCTQTGLFSLFYGLPANYWDTALYHKRGAVLVHELLQNNYATAIFTSAPLSFPAFDQTIFREIKNLPLRTPGDSSADRDRTITQEFLNFLSTRDQNQPFFGFLFYDDAHNYCEREKLSRKPFQPEVDACDRFTLTESSNPTPYVNRYHNAIYFIDHQVKKILDALDQQKLLDDTLVIITSDHGEQINDEQMGYWNHASAYNTYQLHVPMLIYWPGMQPQHYHHFTVSYDLVPTLMTNILGCQNPPEDYAIGRSLFDKSFRPYLISGSYADYAILTKKNTLRIFPGGDYELNDPSGHLLKKAAFDKRLLQKAFHDLSKYLER